MGKHSPSWTAISNIEKCIIISNAKIFIIQVNAAVMSNLIGLGMF